MKRLSLLLVLAAVSFSACAHAPHDRHRFGTPDERLASYLARLDDDRTETIDSRDRRTIVDSGRLLTEIERLAVEFPRHVPTLVTCGVLRFESGDLPRAQAYLDRALALDPVRPEAAVVRARIAMREGNLPFARRLLETRIDRAPQHAGLREALAAVLFLAGDYAGADRALATAANLGAPAWRTDYHRGLAAERAGRSSEAEQFYLRATLANQSFRPAEARLKALEAERATVQ